MADNRFSISGMGENFDIPDDDEISPAEERKRKMLKQFGMSDKEIDEAIEAMKDFNPKETLEQLNAGDRSSIIKQVQEDMNLSKEEAEEFLNGIESMAKSLLGKLDESFSNNPNSNPFNIDKDDYETLDDFDDFDDEDFEEDEEDDSSQQFPLPQQSNEEDESEEDEISDNIENMFDELVGGGTSAPSKSNKKRRNKININGSFESLTTSAAFGVIPLSKDDRLLEKFQSAYGNGPYSVSSFSEEIQGYNLNAAFAELSELKYVDSNEKFIIFEGVPKDPTDSGIAVAIILNGDEFEFIIPEYGNPYDKLSGTLLNKERDPHLYRVNEKSGDLELDKGIDYIKIKTGLDLLTYENKRTILSVKDFGDVIPTLSSFQFPSNRIKIGRIKANDSAAARLFKRDFNLDIDSTIFDFYVRLGYQYPERNLEEVNKYLLGINFNTNIKMQTYELQADFQGNIFIDIDLGALPDNIRKWIMD